MNVSKNQTSVIRRAAKGELTASGSFGGVDRAASVYGFNNSALKKSEKELKSAWMAASYRLRTR